jgi:hypothetical protein
MNLWMNPQKEFKMGQKKRKEMKCLSKEWFNSKITLYQLIHSLGGINPILIDL